MKDHYIRFGPVAGGCGSADIGAVAEDVFALLDARLDRISPGEVYCGGNGDYVVNVRREPDDEEPGLSHCFWLDILLPRDPNSIGELARDAYRRIVASGRYQAALVIEGEPASASHTPASAW